MDYIEAIEDYLQAESTVTVHWLANELSIPLSEAMQLLQNYSKEKDEQITKSHLVIGYDEENQLIFKLVHGDNPVDVKRVLSKQLYSIQKSSSDNISHAIVHSILHQTESLLLQDSLVQDRDSFIYNGLGQVKNSQVKVRLYGERVISSQNLQFKRSASTQGATMVRPAAPQPKKEASTLSAAVAQSAMSFFEKASSASKPVVIAPSSSTIAATKEEDLTPTAPPKFSVLPEKRRLEKQSTANKPSVDSEDEEWDVEIESVKKQKSVASNTTGETSVMHSESTSKVETEKQESEDEESADETAVDNNKENKPRKKRSSTTKKKNVNIRGAMDDFMEDAAIEQHKMEVEQPQVQRKMKKVLVEKCSVDDRGYFVTEMVWEEVPDDGVSFVDTSFTSKIEPLKRSETDSSTKENKINQTEEKKTTSDKPSAKPLQASSKAGGKKQDTKSSGQQKSMMSFFSKK